MVFIKSDILTLKVLRGLSKLKKIKNCSKMNKQELFDTYNRDLGARIIQKRYRKYLYHGAIDHITLESIEHPCFIFKRVKLYFYSYNSIIKYIMKSGNTNDPMTRTSYSDEDLTRLDRGAKKYFPDIKYYSTLKIKNNPEYAKRISNRENEILSFQMRLDEIKNSILIIISNDVISWNISHESILIDDVEYGSIAIYINILINEFTIILITLNQYDHFIAKSYKNNILSELLPYNNEISQVIQEITIL